MRVRRVFALGIFGLGSRFALEGKGREVHIWVENWLQEPRPRDLGMIPSGVDLDKQ